jgi:DnaK suppressor protein
MANRNAASIKKQLAPKKQPTPHHEDAKYMNKKHVDEFREVLFKMLEQCEKDAQEAMLAMRGDNERASDQADMSDVTQRKEEARNQAARLVRKKAEIEAALRRLDNGDYGYCEETGDEIGLDRLRANPLARLSIEAANRQEHLNRLRAR